MIGEAKHESWGRVQDHPMAPSPGLQTGAGSIAEGSGG